MKLEDGSVERRLPTQRLPNRNVPIVLLIFSLKNLIQHISTTFFFPPPSSHRGSPSPFPPNFIISHIKKGPEMKIKINKQTLKQRMTKQNNTRQSLVYCSRLSCQPGAPWLDHLHLRGPPVVTFLLLEPQRTHLLGF